MHAHQPRPAADADVPALVRLINRAYQVEAFFVYGDRIGEAEVRDRATLPNGSFLVVDGEEPGALAGGVYVELRGARGYFGLLSVDPDAQGRGLGRALVEAAERRCRDAGCRFVDISVVNLRSELPAFYVRLGYAPYDTAPFPPHERLKRAAHFVLMTKPLVDVWA